MQHMLSWLVCRYGYSAQLPRRRRVTLSRGRLPLRSRNHKTPGKKNKKHADNPLMTRKIPRILSSLMSHRIYQKNSKDKLFASYSRLGVLKCCKMLIFIIFRVAWAASTQLQELRRQLHKRFSCTKVNLTLPFPTKVKLCQIHIR